MANDEYRKRLPSAVVFTHFGSLRKGIGHIRNYKPIFKRYLECNKEENLLSIVYIYVDYALHAVVDKKQKKERSGNVLAIDPNILAEEKEIMSNLLALEDETRQEPDVPRSQLTFQYVGINELIELLNSIRDIDNSLVKYLAAPDGKFTYDSPKFVEAIIRIARGNHPFLAINPIVRIDEDSEPNSISIKKLIEAYMGMRSSSFFFFSGSYGDINRGYDPINDHAVRTHWFFPEGTKKGKVELGEDPIIYPLHTTDTEKAEILNKINIFLSDLTELGGKQKDGTYSLNLRTILASGRARKTSSDSPQVISGAGLIMNHKAVNLLPPFMNFALLTTWVDDHIKRSLHEAIKDIKPDALQSLKDVRFRQNRHPEGIRHDAKDKEKDDYYWAQKFYFERLLRGCLLDRIVKNVDGSATSYSNWVGQITKFKDISKITNVQNEFNKRKNISLNSAHPLIPEMLTQTYERYDEVIKCWKSAEFSGTLLYQWADLMDNKKEKRRICVALIKDAIAYIDLVIVWPTFRSAIMRLGVRSNFWLFRDIYRGD